MIAILKMSICWWPGRILVTVLLVLVSHSASRSVPTPSRPGNQSP